MTFLVLICFNLHGQSRFRFQTLGMEQGLSSNAVTSICEDRFGYIWIATENGINRYDGHNIRQYLYNINDSFSIPGNSVRWIHKDKEGGLWFWYQDRNFGLLR